MIKNLNILHLEDNYYDFELLSSILLEELPCNIVHASNKTDFFNALKQEKFDLIISDYSLPEYSGIEALTYALENYSDTPFIFVSGTIGEEKAIECIKKGARDYIIKDRPKRLVPSIKNIIKEETEKREKKKLEEDYLRLQRVENIGSMASGIAHDLNNVLTPILMASEILMMEMTDDKNMPMISIIQKSVSHATDLIRQILTFGRGVDEIKNNININSIVSDIVYMIKSTFPKTITITQDSSEDLWDITGNQTQINQVLLNLCVNARDAMSKEGSLKISTKNIIVDQACGMEPGKYLEISVSDTGEGISPEIINNVFEPFFTTKEKGKGTGLGLATTKEIVKKHGGFIKLKSEPGVGTEFKIYFPTMKIEEGKNPVIDSGKIPVGNNELVLVVDDDISIRNMMKAALEVYNYRVLTASEGVEAISVYSKNSAEISVVFVDLMMPLMDGIDTITVLREINPKSKIIALTGLADGRNLLGNPDVYSILQKPFAIEQMLINLDEVLKINN
jgi:signal transduction histidine kinase